MASISGYVTAIREAQYGEEVRGSIADALVAMNVETEADTVTANAANTKSDNAVSTANTANSKSDNAVSVANAANTKSDNAVSTANTANTKSDNAVDTANTADTKSDSAVNTANAAYNAAVTAQSSASANAQATANDRQAVLTMKGSVEDYVQHVDGVSDHVDSIKSDVDDTKIYIDNKKEYIDGVAETVHADMVDADHSQELAAEYAEIARQAGIQKLVSVGFVLYRDEWTIVESNNEVYTYAQEVDVIDMTPTTVGFVGISNQATETQRLALADTNVVLSGQGENKLYFLADDIPAVDIPMVVIY